MSYTITFNYQENNQNKSKYYTKSANFLIEDLLKEFLKDTNSKNVIDPDFITFTTGSGTIINRAGYIDNRPQLNLKQVFKTNINGTINVVDTDGIIGGKSKIK